MNMPGFITDTMIATTFQTGYKVPRLALEDGAGMVFPQGCNWWRCAGAVASCISTCNWDPGCLISCVGEPCLPCITSLIG